MSKLSEQFVKSFAEEISNLNGTNFEYLCKTIFSIITNQEVLHKGHNLDTKPVGYTADFISSDLKIFGQCGTEADYFKDLNKPIHDIHRSLQNHKVCERVILFANQRASGGAISQLQIEIKVTWQNLSVEIFDSERIAYVILNNIHNTAKTEEVLEFLPKTYEYYRILPQTNILPLFKSRYYERNEEKDILDLLNNYSLIQIFGISGIGKSEISISIANKLKNDFDSIVWVSGESLPAEIRDLSSIHISRFGNALNLEYFLQEFKILVVVDNLNDNVIEFQSIFDASNKHGSKCIVTSLQRNLPLEQSYNLKFITNDISKNILNNSKNPPNDEQSKLIINEISGYPLVLNLMVSSVDVDDFSWEEIIHEITNLQNFPVSKNTKLSEKIIGKFKTVIDRELQWLKTIDSTMISRHFLRECVGKKGQIELEKRSIISVQDSFFFSTHQLILDSIKSEVTINDREFIFSHLEKYLLKYNEIKNVEYFRFLITHKSFVQKIYEDSNAAPNLKKVILYALIQSSDSFNHPEQFIKELCKTDYHPEVAYYDLLLHIEKQEIELFQLNKTTEEYQTACDAAIDELSAISNSTTDPSFRILARHHIGKFYARKRDNQNAIKYFNLVLEEDSTADYSRLQLARVYLNIRDVEKAKLQIDHVLSRDYDIQSQSLSILLSFFELLSREELRDARKKYIDDKIDSFIKVMLSSIDSSFEQPYMVLENLSGHLGYLQKESFAAICEALPFPENIDSNKKLKLAFAKIKLSQYKMLKFSSQPTKEREEAVLRIAEKYFNSIEFGSDFERKSLIDLLITSKQFDKAEAFASTFEDKNTPFFSQTLSKILRGKGDLDGALAAIDQAIQNSGELMPFYQSAFLNDKAEVLHQKGDSTCIEILQSAIEKQSTQKTKLSWEMKKEQWAVEFNKSE